MALFKKKMDRTVSFASLTNYWFFLFLTYYYAKAAQFLNFWQIGTLEFYDMIIWIYDRS